MWQMTSALLARGQAMLWICMPVFWGSALHDLFFVLRWKFEVSELQMILRKHFKGTCNPCVGSPNHVFSPGCQNRAGRGLPRQRPLRPRGGGGLKGGRFGMKVKQEAQGVRNHRPGALTLRKIIPYGWNKAISSLILKNFIKILHGQFQGKGIPRK